MRYGLQILRPDPFRRMPPNLLKTPAHESFFSQLLVEFRYADDLQLAIMLTDRDIVMGQGHHYA